MPPARRFPHNLFAVDSSARNIQAEVDTSTFPPTVTYEPGPLAELLDGDIVFPNGDRFRSGISSSQKYSARLARCSPDVRESSDGLVDWRGKVAVGALLRETLREVSRQPFVRILVPALVLGGWAWSVDALDNGLETQCLTVLAVSVLVALWGWTAQGVARNRRPSGVFHLTMLVLFLLTGAVLVARRFGTGWEPFTIAVLLPGLIPFAVPAGAVDGLHPKVMLRDSWNAGRGSLLRVWAACGVVAAGHLAMLAFVTAGAQRLSLGEPAMLAAVCLVAGSAFGAATTLSSTVYLQLRNLRRVSDVSSWVEVFR